MCLQSGLSFVVQTEEGKVQKPALRYHTSMHSSPTHVWEHGRPQWLCSPLSIPLVFILQLQPGWTIALFPPTWSVLNLQQCEKECQAWVCCDAWYIVYCRLPGLCTQGSVGIWKSDTSRQCFLGFFLRTWGQFLVLCVYLWGCCPSHVLGKFREYIYCKRTGNKNFWWNSAYVHSHTKIVNLLNSQSSRKSARIKKIWFTNIIKQHIVLYGAETSHTEVTSLCLLSTWLEACSFLGEKKYVLVELFSFV